MPVFRWLSVSGPGQRQILIGETKQTGFPICSYTHGVGSLVFGEDGTLLVSAGDGATADTVDQGGNVSGSYAPQALADGIIRPRRISELCARNWWIR